MTPPAASKTPHRAERAFGYPVGTVCLLLAGLFFWKGRPAVSSALLGIGATLLATGWLCPAVLQHPSRWWMRFAHVLGWINSRVLLSIFFFLIITPVGFIMRLTGWDALRIKRTRVTGWQPYPARLRNPKHYERMY